MAAACGLDNRAALPPYFPVGRNEDGIFGSVVQRCFRHAYFAHLPLSLLHSPPGRRVFSAEWVHILGIPRLSDAILCAIAAFEPPSARLPARLYIAALGLHLQRLGRMPPGALYALLAYYWQAALGARLTEVDELLAQNKAAPAFWRTLMEHCAMSLRAYLDRDNASTDFQSSAPAGMTIGTLLHLYGVLLTAWRCLSETAGNLARTIRPIGARRVKSGLGTCETRASGNVDRRNDREGAQHLIG
jgi:hypothetical protein